MLDLATLPREDRERLAGLLEERQRRARQRLFFDLYPDATVYKDGSVARLWNEIELWGRDLYPRHLEFFRAGATYRERGAICGNRIGKTLGLGAYETTAHLTGLYPAWWEGRRFPKPVRAWAVGETFESTRDAVQPALLGTVGGADGRKAVSGTGMIPGNLLDRPTWKSGVPDLVDTVRVKHASGGWSLLGLKAYQQGIGSFTGTAQHVIWCDELCPEDIWGECVTRTATTDGVAYLTVTPIKGLTGAVVKFFADET